MVTFSTKKFFDKKDYHKIMIKEDAGECRKTTEYFQKERKKIFWYLMLITFLLSLAQWSVSSWDASFRDGTSSFAQRDMSFLRMKNQQIYFKSRWSYFSFFDSQFSSAKSQLLTPLFSVYVCTFTLHNQGKKSFLLRATFLEVFYFARIPQLVASQLVQKS